MQRLAVVMVMLAALLGACSAGDSEEAQDVGADAGDAAAGGATDAAARDEAGREAAAEAAPAQGDDEGSVPQGAGLGEGGVLPASVATINDGRVIKEGTVTVEVEEGGFEDAFAGVMEVARRLGGGVTASATSTAPDGHTSGSLTVRVPVESYEDLLVGVGAIGEVTDRRITAQDVTGEFIDLEARRRQLRAQEEFYLGLLAEIEAVDDAVRVRGELDRIQTEIERITGRLTYLEDRTAFSTLTVELFEPGAPPPATEAPQPGLARYWQTGLDALVAAAGTLLVVGLGSLPFVFVLGAILAVVRALRRRPATNA